MKKKIKGVWFYGLSGSGKTFISKTIKKKIPNSVIIDGDKVRKLISKDLNYSRNDRKIQIRRILGISKIVVDSNIFSISSSVYYDKFVQNKCKKIGILPIKIIRKNFNRILKTHKTYKNKSNVVGRDIFYQNIQTIEVINDGSSKLIKKIINLIKNR
tara:strand:+ start:201 stop:671 length:471 start_codon:yes stop_codon:yes gene_type:complete